MSPEQAAGSTADNRSDQFSFGLVLYEMLTGRRAFSRPSAVETLAAIIRDDPPPIGQLNPSVPAPVRWIVDRCLAKNPADRYGSTRDLARDLASARDHFSELIGLGHDRHISHRSRPRRSRARVFRLAAGWSARAHHDRPGRPPDAGAIAGRPAGRCGSPSRRQRTSASTWNIGIVAICRLARRTVIWCSPASALTKRQRVLAPVVRFARITADPRD